MSSNLIPFIIKNEDVNILDYILNILKKKFTQDEINLLISEINIFFEKAVNNRCSIIYRYVSPYTVVGNNFTSVNDLFNYLNIVPNIFRQCWVSKDITLIPNICPLFFYVTELLIFIPKIIDLKYIKSFFYFGFPNIIDNVLKNPNVNFIKNLAQNIILRQKYQNYSSKYQNYSSKYYIKKYINDFYTDKSLLIQYISLFNYMNTVSNNYGSGKTLNNYYLPWFCTISCECLNPSISDTTVENNTSKTNILTTLDFLNIQKLYLNAERYKFTAILKIAQEVFQDIVVQITYYLEDKEYCLKDYMRVKNLPVLTEYYTNYLNNIRKLNKEL
jgi:hypothetical protein